LANNHGEAHNYQTTQSLISNWTKLDKMAVFKSLKALVALGFIYRSENKVDTRGKNASLTKKGKNFTHQ
jgi:DNA-binding MarR family transcriptional regulator